MYPGMAFGSKARLLPANILLWNGTYLNYLYFEIGIQPSISLQPGLYNEDMTDWVQI